MARRKTEFPVFGRPVPGRLYFDHLMVMGVVWNDAGELAVVQTSERGYTLPGGPEMEDRCALDVHVGAATGYLLKQTRQWQLGYCTEIEKHGRFTWSIIHSRVRLRVSDDVRRRFWGEPTGEVRWLDPATAERKLGTDMHKWVVRTFGQAMIP